MENLYKKQNITNRLKYDFSFKKLLVVLLLVSVTNISQLFAQSPFCESYATSQCCEWVTRVMMNDGTMTMPTTTPTYMDYTATALTSVTAGTSFNIEVDVTTNNTYLEYVYIWFDMNQDDVIQDPAELLYTGNATFNGLHTYSSTISVPTTAYNGHMYVRVLMSYNALPVLCGTYSYGNTFDFLVNVIGGSPNPTNKTLTVAKSGAGTGEITSNPSGINTAIGFNSFDFPTNEVVTLTATPTGDSNFAGWSGDASGTANDYVITLDANKSCTATFNGPIISSQPIDQLNICSGESTIFNISATGTNIAYQWKKDGLNLGTNSSSLSILNVDIGDVGSYSCTVTCDEGTEVSSVASLSIDGINPTVITQNITVNLDETGNASIIPSDIDTGSDDNCGINDMILDISDFTCVNIGANTVNLTVTDLNGNVATGSAIVTVEDNINPVVDIVNLPDLTGECSINTPTAPTATDNCSSSVEGTTTTIFPIITQGTTIIIWIYDDGNGNSITQNQNAIIDDITNPEIPILVDVTGECSATATVPTTTDNCSGTISGTSSDALTYTTQGTHIITWNFDDGNGNNIDVTQNVIVNDVTNPETPILTDVTGECSATANVPTTTDNCDGLITGTSSDALTYSTQGTHVITWNFDDGNGNNIDVTQNVIINDVTNPETPILTDVTGECSATANVPTTTDNCEGTITGTSSDALTYTTQGTHIITWNFDDGNGNNINVTQNVIVDDVTNPETPILTDVTGECSATATVPTTTDNCSGTISGTTSDALTYTTQGTYIITWNFDDGNGNNIDVTQNVIIDDVTNPETPILTDVTGECSATATVPTTTDNCSGTISGTSSDALTYTTQGTHVITWNFDDGNGNSIDVTQNVIVDDITEPIADHTILPDVTGECTATIIDIPTATDNCQGTIIATTTDLLTYSTQGSHIVTWQFDDGNGNTSTQTQNVIVDDITEPIADLTILPDVTGECTATITDIPTATDNCQGTITATTTDMLTYSTQGSHLVTWYYDDGNGNISTQTQNVIIEDITNPIAIAQDITVYFDINGNVSITENDINNGSYDNCSIESMSLDIYDFSSENIGDNTVILTLTDIGGNSATAVAIVTIEDDLPPVIITCASDITKTAEEGCETTVPDFTQDNTVEDNCTLYDNLIITQNPETGTLVENGLTGVSITIADESGNEAYCNLTFEVICNEKIIVPQGFSPNGDGINDYFVIHGLNELYPKHQIIIMNRWGNKVYEASPYNNDWNGKKAFGVSVGGTELPEGSYFYIIELGDNQNPIKGYIYLNR